MKYIVRNLKTLLCNEPIIAILMFLCVLVSSTVLHFAYGLYQNYSAKLLSDKSSSNELHITIMDGNSITQSKLRECLFSLPDEINNVVGIYLVTTNMECNDPDPFINTMEIRFSVDKNKITPSESFMEIIKSEGQLIGDYFSPKQEAMGENVAIIPTDKEYLQYTKTEEKDGNLFVTIQNKEFRVIGKINTIYYPTIPFEALDDETTFQGTIVISLKDDRYLTKYEYSKISDTFTACFGNNISIPRLNLPDEDSAKFYRTIMILSILISLISAVNYIMLYKYILQIRRRKFALFRMLGCRKSKILCISLGECAMIMLPCYLLAFILYVKLLIPIFTPLYPNMVSISSPKFYIVIFLCYFSISLIAILIMMIRFLLKSWLIKDIRGK